MAAPSDFEREVAESRRYYMRLKAEARERERAEVEPRLTRYIPHLPEPKQSAFLVLPHREAFYGGAAGGGKSDALLMGALQHVDIPGYSALILRKTYAQLSKADALIPRSHEWLARTDAAWNGDTKTWRFPSGARVEFGHLDNDNAKYNYQSAAYQYIAFDEVTDLEEKTYVFLFSRLRRLASFPVTLRIRAASNPGGPGHDWVQSRFNLPVGRPERPYIPASIDDNPHLDREAYRESLSHLDPLTRAQIERGDWNVRAEGGYFRREWFEVVTDVPAKLNLVRYWDLAASDPSESEDPDWTAGCLMGKSREGIYYIMDMARVRARPQPRDNFILSTVRGDGKRPIIFVEQEPGASGKSAVDYMIRHLLTGYPVYPDRPTGDKVTRARPLSSAAEAGNVKIVRGDWNHDFMAEAEAFPQGAHMDQIDASSGAFSRLMGRVPGDYGVTL